VDFWVDLKRKAKSVKREAGSVKRAWEESVDGRWETVDENRGWFPLQWGRGLG